MLQDPPTVSLRLQTVERSTVLRGDVLIGSLWFLSEYEEDEHRLKPRPHLEAVNHSSVAEVMQESTFCVGFAQVHSMSVDVGAGF